MNRARLKTIASFLPSGVLILAGTVGLAAAALQPKPQTPLGVVVLGQNSAGSLRVIAAADGRLVSTGGWLGIAIAASDDPDFVARLYRAGASYVFRADGAVGCNDLLTARKKQDS